VNYQYKFTVFTPCYNSEKFLHRVFDSLQNQTFRNFEWIVINDASLDNTHELLERLIKKANFPINYIRNQKNLMLSINYNIAIREARGAFFMPIGHDDAFIPETLETYFNYWERYGSDVFSGITCLCQDQFGNLIGDKFPASPYFSNYFDIVYNRKIKGEKCGIIRTDVIKRFLLPEDVDVYVSEGLIWLNIGKEFKTIFLNEIIRTYYVNEIEHRSLSWILKNKVQYPQGQKYLSLQMINTFHKLINHNYIIKVKDYINYIRMSLFVGISPSKMLKEILLISKKTILCILFPIGFLSFIKMRMNKKVE
jgi:glycosyltransferase involved in cell wall biosynthesis